MHALLRPCLPLVLLLFVACSPSPDQRVSSPESSSVVGPAPAVVAQQEERKCNDDPEPGEENALPRCTGPGITETVKPRAYHVASEGGECVIEGDACSLEQPFKLSGCGIKDYFTFTPASATAGSYAYQGTMMGARVSGGGDYSVDAGESGGSLQTVASRNCADAGGAIGCNGINIRFKLTPIAACEAAS